MSFVIVFVLVVFVLWLLPGSLEKVFSKYVKRFLKKQIKHEIRRFK